MEMTAFENRNLKANITKLAGCDASSSHSRRSGRDHVSGERFKLRIHLNITFQMFVAAFHVFIILSIAGSLELGPKC